MVSVTRPFCSNDLDRSRQTGSESQSFRYAFAPLAGERYINFDGQALTTPFVDHCEGAVSAATRQTVVDEVHRPGLVGAARQRPRSRAFAPPSRHLAASSRSRFALDLERY